MRVKSNSNKLIFPFLIILFSFLLIISYLQTPLKISRQNSKIGIVVVLTNDTNPNDYEIALKSVECYARSQNYYFQIVVDSDYNCHQNDKFFRRHCVVSFILPRFDTVLFIDADHGVVNPKRRIEEYMDPQFDITFYDRFFNWEVMAGSYIVKNTKFSIDFLTEFANFEEKLPKGAHGSDNGAIHLFLAEKIFPEGVNVEICREVYYKSVNTFDLAAYTACIRGIFGSRTDFGNIRIMKKGSGWSRDDWLTSGLWNPSRDFMLHGWKTKQMKDAPNEVLKPIPMNYAQWYNPFSGPIIIGRCFEGNTTWSYSNRLLADKREIDVALHNYSVKVEREKANSLSRISEVLDKD